jgi:hypothetical protein
MLALQSPVPESAAATAQTATPLMHFLQTLVHAETTVNLQAKLTNTGNVKLRTLAWTPSWGSGSVVWASCTLGDTTPPSPTGVDVTTAEVPVGQELICIGSYTVTQAIMEEGATKRLTANIALKVTDVNATLALPANEGTFVDIPVTITPRLTITISDVDCIKPFRAGGLA